MRPRSAFLPLCLLFFLSGACGLTYQVLWLRLLALVFGVTVHAASTVLAAFMAGLALGAMLAGRLVRRADPLRIFAALEAGIAAAALATPALLALATGVYRPLSAAFPDALALLTVARFICSAAVLLLPTVLMGATLPVLSRAAASVDALGARIGRLYAVNTLGAVAGCFLTGFALLELLGVRGTILAAALVNLFIAAVACLLAAAPWAPPEADGAREASAPLAATPPSALTRWLPFVYGVSGFVALALEVTWTRGLIFSFFLGASTYAFATMLTVFLFGLGLGSLLMAMVVDRLPNRVRALAWGEIVIGLSALLSAPLLLWLSGMHSSESGASSWLAATGRDLTKTALIMLVPTLAMGALFPLLTRVFVGSAASAGRGVGRLYFANTTGAILGSLGAGFVLVPYLGVGRSIVLLGCVSLLLGALLAWNDLDATPGERRGTTFGALAAVVLLPLVIPSGRPFQQIAPGEEMLFYMEGSSGTVAAVQAANGERRLQIDNVWIAGTNLVMQTAHKTLAHFGALLHPAPHKALAVGFASGGTSWSYTKHPELRQIDCVEIADTVLDARPYFSEVNGTVTEDPRYRVILEDARTFLLLGRDPYDLIATDCTDLRYKSDANLYTVEYFDICKSRLADDGMLVVFLPFGGLTDDLFRGVLGTFLHAFPQGSVWYVSNYPTHYLLLVGTRQPLRVDWPTFRDRLAVPAVHDDLSKVGLADPFRILASYVASGETLASFVAGARLNTVDRPWVEFEAPRRDTPGMLDNLETLLGYAPSALPEIEGMSAEERATLARYARATRYVVRAQIHVTRKQNDQARFEFEAALREFGKDALIEQQLGISSAHRYLLEKMAASQPPDLRTRYDLAVLLRRLGELPRSESMLRELLSDPDLRFSAEMSLALTVEQLGRASEGEEHYRAALAAAPNDNLKEVARRGLELLQAREKVRAHPDDEQAVLDLAQGYVRYQDLYEALRALQTRADERNEPRVLEALTALELQAHMVERAQESATRLVTLTPDDAAAHYYLLDASLRLGKLDQALREFEASKAIDDTNFSLWFTGARLYRLLGREDECAAALRKALALGGARLLSLARQDPVLAGSPSLDTIEKEYLGAPAPAPALPR